MDQACADHGETVCEVRGDRIASLEDFYREIGEAVNGPGRYFGTQLRRLQ
jgi:hypothetical protein